MKRKVAGKHGRTEARNAADAIHRAQKLERHFIPGDDADLTTDVLKNGKRDAALAAAQKYFCGLPPPERILSEELLQERREEAQCER